MAERERVSQQKQREADQEHRIRHQESQPSSEQLHAWEQDKFSMGETPFLPRMNKHTAMLAGARSDEQRASMALQLQRTYGNRYVQRLIESMGAQAKLTVSTPDDVYEQEADRVTDTVTKALTLKTQRQAEEEEKEEELQPKPLLQRQVDEEEEELQPKPLLQRQVDEEEEELQPKPLLQRQAEEEEEEVPIQTQSVDSGIPVVSGEVETRVNSARGSGHLLADTVREPMEQAFGADFSGVRVHTDSEANMLNQHLSARAFTTGQDVFFREGEYSPGSDSGRKLLAHELTHVVQQSTGLLARIGKRIARNIAKKTRVYFYPRINSWRGQVVQRAISDEDLGRLGISRELYDNIEQDRKAFIEMMIAGGRLEQAKKSVRKSIEEMVLAEKLEMDYLNLRKVDIEYAEETTKQREGIVSDIGGLVSQCRVIYIAIRAETQKIVQARKKLNSVWTWFKKTKDKLRGIITQARGQVQVYKGLLAGQLSKLRKQDVAITEDNIKEITANPDAAQQQTAQRVFLEGLLAGRVVKHDTPEEQVRTKVSIAGGTLKRYNDELVDTADSAVWGRGNGWEIFVMSPTGDIHMASHKIGKYHHSSLLAARAVAAAGEIKVTNGKIENLVDKSGHYKPGSEQTVQILHELNKQGVPLDFQLECRQDGAKFTGLAADYMKPKKVGGKGGEEQFQLSQTQAVIAYFTEKKGLEAVKTAFAQNNWKYISKEGTKKFSLKKPDKKTPTHLEVRALLTGYFVQKPEPRRK